MVLVRTKGLNNGQTETTGWLTGHLLACVAVPRSNGNACYLLELGECFYAVAAYQPVEMRTERGKEDMRERVE